MFIENLGEHFCNGRGIVGPCSIGTARIISFAFRFDSGEDLSTKIRVPDEVINGVVAEDRKGHIDLGIDHVVQRTFDIERHLRRSARRCEEPTGGTR